MDYAARLVLMDSWLIAVDSRRLCFCADMKNLVFGADGDIYSFGRDAGCCFTSLCVVEWFTESEIARIAR